jgi:hypothetical protein
MDAPAMMAVVKITSPVLSWCKHHAIEVESLVIVREERHSRKLTAKVPLWAKWVHDNCAPWEHVHLIECVRENPDRASAAEAVIALDNPEDEEMIIELLTGASAMDRDRLWQRRRK